MIEYGQAAWFRSKYPNLVDGAIAARCGNLVLGAHNIGVQRAGVGGAGLLSVPGGGARLAAHHTQGQHVMDGWMD